jgi:hypothetical protein
MSSHRTIRSIIFSATAVVALASAGAIASAPATAVGSWSAPTYIYAASSIQSQGYSYAPSAIAGSPDFTYTCHSRSSGTVRDDIFLTSRSGGSVTSSVSVLAGTGSGWDGFHNCDPSVIRVNSTVSGHTYSYAMFYLGNDADCSCHNQVGIAYADSLTGPWTKSGSPVVTFNSSAPTSDWGAGQPTATTIDASAGTAVLAWTEGYTSTGTVAKMAQVSLGSGTPSLSSVHTIPTSGLTDANGSADYANNFDLVYSPQRDRFYVVRELHPYPASSPNYISTAVQVDSISGSNLWGGTGSWTVESMIGSSVSGKARTHNPGFLRTIYGTLPDESHISVRYTTANLDPGALWTYAVYESTATL